VTHTDGDASPTAPAVVAPGPAAGPVPSGAPSSAALPPTAVAAAAAATAAATGATATESNARPTAADSATTAGTPTDARLDPALAGSATKPGAIAGGSVPGAAVADAAATLPSPLHDAVAQAQRDLQIRRAEQVTRLGIDLATDGLGVIHVEASNAGGGLHLQLGADRSATRQLLAEHAAALRDELGAGGTSVSVDVGRGDAGRSDQRPGEPAVPFVPGTARHTARSAAEPGTPTSTAVRTPLSGDGGVDVRI
jgi:flagellar hook-length control protein FliK